MTFTVHVALPARAGGGNKSNPGKSTSSKSSTAKGGSSSSFTGTTTRTSSSSSGGGSIVGGLCCLVLLVVVVVVVVLMLKKKGASTTSSPAGGAQPYAPPPIPPQPAYQPPPGGGRDPRVQAGLDAIRSTDPAFDEAGFLNGVATSFMLVQQAWVEQQPDQSRKVMADSLWVAHKQKIDDMAARGVQNRLDDLHIGRSEVIAADADADSQTITVRITAFSQDYEVEKATGRQVGGDREGRLWTEDWVFTRKAGAQTKEGSGTRETCQNCGAPLNLDASGTCGYCRVQVMAGNHDWVLSRIEQVYSP